MRTHTTTRSGFSLIELLVTIGIMGVVTTMGVKVFSNMNSRWVETKTLTVLDNSVDTVFETIGRDLADTLSAELSGYSIIGEDREWVNPKDHKPAPDQNDRIVIPIQGSLGGVERAVAIQYGVARDTEAAMLMRSTKSLDSETWLNPLNIIPEADTLAFDIEYATDNPETPWVKEWTASTLPKAVRVGIVVADRDNAYYQLSRKAVFTIAVQ